MLYLAAKPLYLGIAPTERADPPARRGIFVTRGILRENRMMIPRSLVLEGFPAYLAPWPASRTRSSGNSAKNTARYSHDRILSAEEIFRRNERTRELSRLHKVERPIGVQLFGANAEHMAEAGAGRRLGATGF